MADDIDDPTPSTRARRSGVPSCPCCGETAHIEPLRQVDHLWYLRCLNCHCGYTMTASALRQPERGERDRRSLARGGRRRPISMGRSYASTAAAMRWLAGSGRQKSCGPAVRAAGGCRAWLRPPTPENRHGMVRRPADTEGETRDYAIILPRVASQRTDATGRTSRAPAPPVRRMPRRATTPAIRNGDAKGLDSRRARQSRLIHSASVRLDCSRLARCPATTAIDARPRSSATHSLDSWCGWEASASRVSNPRASCPGWPKRR